METEQQTENILIEFLAYCKRIDGFVEGLINDGKLYVKLTSTTGWPGKPDWNDWHITQCSYEAGSTATTWEREYVFEVQRKHWLNDSA